MKTHSISAFVKSQPSRWWTFPLFTWAALIVGITYSQASPSPSGIPFAILEYYWIGALAVTLTLGSYVFDRHVKK